MNIQFLSHPGAHERHLQRKHQNPLFPEKQRNVGAVDLQEARQRDQQELQDFMDEFQKLVHQATELDAQVDNELVLHLKQELEQAYVYCASLAGDLQPMRDAIKQLIAAIMGAIYKSAELEPAILSQLHEEETARNIFFELLEQPLIADLLRQDGIIQETELAATVLSASADALQDVMQFLDTEQIQTICSHAHSLLVQQQKAGYSLADAWARLSEMEEWTEDEDKPLN